MSSDHAQERASARQEVIAAAEAQSRERKAKQTQRDDRPPLTAAQHRRKSLVTIVLLVAAAACLWGSSRMGWVHYTSFDGLQPPKSATISGNDWAAELTPLALVMLAAIAASLAVRGWAVRVVGVLVGLAAAAAAVRALTTLTSDVPTGRIVGIAELPAGTAVAGASLDAWAAGVVLLGAVLALGAAFLLMRRPGSRKGLSSKYETPAARREAASERVSALSEEGGQADGDEALSQRMMWDALDAGEDPTRAESESDEHGR